MNAPRYMTSVNCRLIFFGRVRNDQSELTPEAVDGQSPEAGRAEV